MQLDLVSHPVYQQYYQWLRPSARRGFNGEVAAMYRRIWKPSREYDDNDFQSFPIIRESIVPTITNGFRDNPTRAELLEALVRVRGGQLNEQNNVELAIAVMLASRDERWSILANAKQAEVPTEFVLYRYVHGLDFCRDVAHAFKTTGGSPRFLRLRHDAVSSWSLTREGALCIRRDQRRPGVLFKAIIPFDRTLADILVDDSTFQNAYHRQAEVVVTALPNTIECLPVGVEVYLGTQVYTEQTWAQMEAYLKSLKRVA